MLPGMQKNIRLKDYVFSDNFISLDSTGKTNKIKEIAKEKTVYIDIGSEKKVDRNNLDTLADWKLRGALLQKYWNQFSKYDKAKYAKMKAHEKLDFLNQKKDNHYKKVEEQNANIGSPNAGEYSRIIARYIQGITRNIEAASDDIERVSGIEVSAATARGRVRESRRRNTRQVQEDRSRSNTDWAKSEFSSRAYKPRLNQAVIDKLVCEMNDEDWIVRNNKQIEEVKKNLNATTVLEMLAITHGVLPAKYKVEAGSDGNDRIICGNHKYNVVDFLFKELNFNWNETKDMLSIAIKMQLDVDRERGYDPQAAKYLWTEYQEWFNGHKKDVESGLNKYKLDYKDLKENIRKWYAAEVRKLSEKYEGYFHKINQEKQKLKAEKIIRENNLKATRMAEYQKLKSELNIKLQDAYRDFLLQKAIVENDEIALRELRRLRLDFEEYEKQGSIRRTEVYYEHRLSIKFMIDKNGLINYLDGDKVFIKDTGHRIDVAYSNDDNIGFIVDLALKKYGRHVSLDGTDEFKKRFIEYCANNNIEMTYKDKWSKCYLDEYKNILASNHAALMAAKALEKEQNSFTSSRSYKDVILADVTTIHGNSYPDSVKNSVNVTLIDKNTNEVIKLAGAYLKTLDKLPRGALIDVEINYNNNEDKTKCKTLVKDYNYLKTLNSIYSEPMPVISTDGVSAKCNFKKRKATVRNEVITRAANKLINEELAKQQADSSCVKSLYYGIVLEFGEAEKPGRILPFLKLETPEGKQQVLWDQKLKNIINESNIKPGQHIVLAKLDQSHNGQILITHFNPDISLDASEVNQVEQIAVEQGERVVFPEDKVVTKVVITDSGLQLKIAKVIDSEQKKQLIDQIISEDCKVAAEDLKRESNGEAKIYQISGKYISSGIGVDPFYKKDSFYILLRTQEGKLKSIWGKELAKLTQQVKFEKSRVYAVSKVTGQAKYSIKEVGVDINQRIQKYTQYISRDLSL